VSRGPKLANSRSSASHAGQRGQARGGLSPGFGMQGTEIIFPLSTTLALRGTFDGEENVIDADASTVGAVNLPGSEPNETANQCYDPRNEHGPVRSCAAELDTQSPKIERTDEHGDKKTF
jgi:hypothetical protein